MRPREWDDIDLDWDSPPCSEHCGCPLCQHADADEQRLLARVDDAELIDLDALAIAAARPWQEGEAA